MSPRPPQPPADDERNRPLGAELSRLPVPDHGPNFWADLSERLSGETQSPTTDPALIRAEGETTVPFPTEPATGELHQPPPTAIGPEATSPERSPISLDEQRARRAGRRGRTSRSLGAAAAAVAVILGAAGAVSVLRDGDGDDRQVETAGRPTDTTQQPAPAVPAVPAEFSATYDGIEGFDGPEGCCSQWRLTLAADGSFRWTSTDGMADMAYDAPAGTHVHKMTIGPGVSADRPNYFVTARIPAGGPDMRYARPDPLGPIADFVVALARAGDSRITTSSVAGRATWHYDGPTAVDRLGGDGAPNHAVADVDQATGVLLALTTRVDDLVVNRFTASAAATRDTTDRSQYTIVLPPGAQKTEVDLGFEPRTFEQAAAELSYDLLLPDDAAVPAGFRLSSLTVNKAVASPTGPEGMNPPAKNVAAVTWTSGANRFTITLRPSGGEQWDNPFGAEGVVAAAKPVNLPLAGRPPLEGSVTVDAPLRPNLWGITGDIVVTVDGDLSSAELERVAGSLRASK